MPSVVQLYEWTDIVDSCRLYQSQNGASRAAGNTTTGTQHHTASSGQHHYAVMHLLYAACVNVYGNESLQCYETAEELFKKHHDR